jgi:hypothetical protein
MNGDFAMPPSIRRLLVAAAALLALAVPRSAVAAMDPADPRAPVAALYAIEKAGRPTLTTPVERAAALTRGLAAMWDKAEALARRGGDVAIDFDVVTNSQGAEVKSFSLTIERRDAKNATVVATIDPGDWVRQSPRENVITFSLARQAGAWRIDDVGGVAGPNAWSLRNLLARALKAQ